MAKVAAQLKGVNITHFPKFYDAEVFCTFEYNGKTFEMTESYGDSSVYDVVGSAEAYKEMVDLARHFESSTPIRGGDAGHRTFYLINWFVGSIIVMGIITYAAKNFS